MKKDKIKQKLDRLTKGLVDLPSIEEHKRPKEPTKEELNKKFVMRVGKSGKLEMKEIKK